MAPFNIHFQSCKYLDENKELNNISLFEGIDISNKFEIFDKKLCNIRFEINKICNRDRDIFIENSDKK